MKQLKRIIILIFVIVSVYLIYKSVTSNPLIFNISKAPENLNSRLNIGDSIKPLNHLNFNEGKWTAYLIISSSDGRNKFKGGKCYMSSNIKLFQMIKNEWQFVFVGGDMATVESSIVFLKDGIKMFESGIVLNTETEGLLSRNLGWLEAKPSQLSNHLQSFELTHKAIIIM